MYKFKTALKYVRYGIEEIISYILWLLASIHALILFPISYNNSGQYTDGNWNIFRILHSKWFILCGGFRSILEEILKPDKK